MSYGIDPAKEIVLKATQVGGYGNNPSSYVYIKKSTVCVCRRDSMFNAFAHADNMDKIAQSANHMLCKDADIFEAQYLMDVIDKVLIAPFFTNKHQPPPAVNIYSLINDLEFVKKIACVRFNMLRLLHCNS